MNSINARRREFLIGSGLCLLLGSRALAAPSSPRRLSLTNSNTGESFDGPYRDADGPIPDAIADLAVLLRDHHVNKVGPVDLATLDFLADVMDATSQGHATVLSAFRTPETNRKLAASAFGAAEKSQHLLGRALDVTFEVRLIDAHAAALKMERGGVGWYPLSHFIHLDSGPIREWQKDGTGLQLLLAGGRPHRQLTVAERNRLRRAYARQEYLKRQHGISNP